MEYPQNDSRNDEITVLHVDEKVNVEKHDAYFTFEADGFSPYTIIVVKSEAPAETTTDSENSADYYSPGTGAASSVLSVCIVLLVLSGIALPIMMVKSRKKMIIK